LSKYEDSSNLEQQLLLTRIHKAAKLIISILCISYFFGLLWYIVVDLSSDSYQSNFIETFGLEGKSESENLVTLTYFIFTSFSTVGLGDYHPVSSLERLVCAFLLVFGVMLTSLVMDNFSKMLKQIQNFNAGFEDSDHLSMFLGTLKRFNHNQQLPSEI